MAKAKKEEAPKKKAKTSAKAKTPAKKKAPAKKKEPAKKKVEEIALPPEPWECQEGESAPAFAAFCEYRDMGAQRSISKVTAKVQKSYTLIGRWSRTHDWVKRAAAWDQEQDRIAREAQLEEIKKMRKRHADLATAMLVKAATALQRLPADEIKASDVSRMVDTAAKLERISRGDSETIIEERQGETAAPSVTFYMPSNGRDDKGEE